MVRGGTRDDERSAHYEALLLAEERGKKERKGLHSAKEPPVQHVNDMSLPGSANKWAPFGVSCPIYARHLYLLPLRMQVHRSALRLPRITARDPSVWLGNSRTKPQVPCRARSAADKRSWSISDVSSALLCRKAELLTETHMMTMYFQRFLYNACKKAVEKISFSFQGKGAAAVVPTNGKGLGRRGIRPFGPQAQGDALSLARILGVFAGFQSLAPHLRIANPLLCSSCSQCQGAMQVFVPKEGVTVLFCPSGVRTPQRGQPMGRDGKPVKVPHVNLLLIDHSTECKAGGPMNVNPMLFDSTTRMSSEQHALCFMSCAGSWCRPDC